MEKQEQIRRIVQRQKQLICEAGEQQEKDYLVLMWCGFLDGLKMTNAITWPEYRELEQEVREFAAGIEAA